MRKTGEKGPYQRYAGVDLGMSPLLKPLKILSALYIIYA